MEAGLTYGGDGAGGGPDPVSGGTPLEAALESAFLTLMDDPRPGYRAGAQAALDALIPAFRPDSTDAAVVAFLDRLAGTGAEFRQGASDVVAGVLAFIAALRAGRQ